MPWPVTCAQSPVAHSALRSRPARSSAVRSARFTRPLIGSPVNFADCLISSPISSQSTGAQAVPLANLMVECLARPEPEVAEAVLDYFNALDYVLMADRDALLRAPLYAQLLPHLLRHAQYPEGFASWEQHVEDDRDEESFKRFR